MTQESVRPAPVSIAARLNRIPVVTRSHRTWTLLLCGVFCFELADLNTFGFAAPGLKEHWGLTVGDIGAVTSAAFLGMMVGALIGGRVADRFGRKWTLIGSAVFYSVFSLATAFAHDLATLAAYRVLTGVGMQAMTVVGLTYISEMYPRALRGRYQALVLAVGLVGIPAMSWFALAVVPAGPDGWRWVFVLGAGGIVIAGLMTRALPESARWLETRGRIAEADAAVTRLEAEAEARLGGGLPAPDPAEEAVSEGRVRELFGPVYRRRALVLAGIWVFGILGFYGFNGWIPTLLVERGYDTLESLTYTSIVALGAVPGALLAWPFVDRWERKNTVLVIDVAIAVLVLVYGFVSEVSVVLVTGFLVSMLLQTHTVFLYTYTPEIFPTRLRGVGTGWGNGLGRLAGFAGGFIVAGVYGAFGYGAVFVYVGGAIFLAGLLMATLGERTANRSLESIAERPEARRR